MNTYCSRCNNLIVTGTVERADLIGIDEPLNPYYLWFCAMCRRSYFEWFDRTIESEEEKRKPTPNNSNTQPVPEHEE